MDSCPHVQEICFRDNLIEVDLRKSDRLPEPLDAIVASYAQYLTSGTLMSRQLLNMLAVLCIADICGISALLVSKFEISPLRQNRIYSPWIDALGEWEVQSGVFMSGSGPRDKARSLYSEFASTEISAQHLDPSPTNMPLSLNDARFLREALIKSRNANQFDPNKNNYTLL
jgi:hypothetical protein